jgi:hypothetical protein
MNLGGKLEYLLANSTIKTWRQVDKLAHWKYGRSNDVARRKGWPRLDRAAALARVFGASLDWLADNHQGPPPVRVGPGMAFLLRLTDAERAAIDRQVAARGWDETLAAAARLLCAADAADAARTSNSGPAVTQTVAGAIRRRAVRTGRPGPASPTAPATPQPGQRRTRHDGRSAGPAG